MRWSFGCFHLRPRSPSIAAPRAHARIFLRARRGEFEDSVALSLSPLLSLALCFFSGEEKSGVESGGGWVCGLNFEMGIGVLDETSSRSA